MTEKRKLYSIVITSKYTYHNYINKFSFEEANELVRMGDLDGTAYPTLCNLFSRTKSLYTDLANKAWTNARDCATTKTI